MPDILIFTLLGAGFVHSFKCSSSLFWDTVNSFGAVWLGNACFWAFWRQNQSSLSSRDNFSLYKVSALLSTVTLFPLYCEIFHLWLWTHRQTCAGFENCSVYPFPVVLSTTWGSLVIGMCSSALGWKHNGRPLGISRVDLLSFQFFTFSHLVCLPSRFSHIWLFVTPWTVTCQASLSMGLCQQEYWSGLPFPSPKDLPDPWIEPRSPEAPAFAGRLLLLIEG